MPSLRPTEAELEKAAVFSYLYCLNLVERDLKSTVETTDRQLNKQGKRIFKNKFVGVYARNTFPFSTLKPGDKGIINTDREGLPGTHWVAVARGVRHTDKVYMYDSFGRKNLIQPQTVQKLPPGARLVDVDPSDAEQREAEDNCGQRSLAWLMVFDQCGEYIADLI